MGRRGRVRKFGTDNGFEEQGGYMAAKKAKLDETGIDRIKEMAKNSVGSQGQCFTCGKVLNSRANAIRHFMLVHSKDQMSSEHPCPKCGKVFRTHNSARDHLRRMHKIYASHK